MKARPSRPDVVASFVVNGGGMGHASRLIAVHDELRRGGALGTVLFASHEQPLLTDYRFRATMIPEFAGIYRGQGSEPSDGRELSTVIIDSRLRHHRPIVLHDVFVHSALYDAAVFARWPQALILRDRSDVEDPRSWIRDIAPAVSEVFWVGHAGEDVAGGEDRPCVYGVEDVVRPPLGHESLWSGDEVHDVRIVVTAGGGGGIGAQGFVAAAVAAVDRFSRTTSRTVAARIVTGPFYDGDLRVPATCPADITVTRYVPPTHDLFAGASVVVAQGGYNTFGELGRSGVPHVLVPARRVADDQEKRAQGRRERHVRVVECDSAAIATAINEVLGVEPLRQWTPAPGRGAAQIAACLCELSARG